MYTLVENPIEPDPDAPRAGLVAPHRPACRIWIHGTHSSGFLEEGKDGAWIIHLAPSSVPGDLSAAARLEFELCADSRLRRRLGAPRFQIHDFEVDAPARQVRWRPLRFAEERARLFRVREPLAVAVTGASLAGRTLTGTVDALSPYEILVTVEDREHLLVPGALLGLEIHRPWQAFFRLHARIASLERGAATRLSLRLLDRTSVEETGALAACECPGFGTHTLWTYGIQPRSLGRLVRVRQAVTEEDRVEVLELRREANQFYGQGSEENDLASWSDSFDERSILLLVSVGEKPVATGRLAAPGEDRGRSEIAQSVELPEAFWKDSFVEISRVAIDPAFRGVGLRVPLLREIGRLTLSLGGRFAVFESIPELVPFFESLGAARLGRTRRPDGGDGTDVLCFDVRKLLQSWPRGSLRWQSVFGPVLGRFESVYGGEMRRLLGGAGGLTYGIKRLLGKAQARWGGEVSLHSDVPQGLRRRPGLLSRFRNLP